MNKHIGSTLDLLLEECGIKEQVHLRFKKFVFVEKLLKTMRAKKVTHAELAKRMRTSRSEVYRLLDPDNTSASLETLARISTALGLDFQINVVPLKHARAA
jgi:antitoxin HicB